MNRNVKYRYNPDTDNFERIYPSWRSRMAKILLFLLCSIGAGVLMMVVFFYSFGTPTEENLRRENAALKSQYNILNRRLDNSLKVMGDIQNRDDNFYRVMMQMEPMSHSQRFAGLDNEHRYKELQKLPANPPPSASICSTAVSTPSQSRSTSCARRPAARKTNSRIYPP